MSTINKVILVGNLGKDPDIRNMSNSKQVASFSIATSENWTSKGSGERVTKTEWHNIVVFNEGLINLIKNYVHKGTKVYLEGALQTRKWTDSNNAERYTTEIVLGPYNSTLRILSSSNSDAFNNDRDHNKSETRNEGQQYQKNLTKIEDSEELDDEIPF